ncbi:hypothetical protein DMB65_09700 [Flavobacterium cheongpyeongense]|uniref:Uncharacterized protein n=1 Tax=Flavobacterium cheongpyeongense TaxID=2212651 RepID=A0A2V4BPB2_9FLAO|nr:hypothetical protein DMB65_09700 [Flavobacterium cheongpyeongense]
MSIRNGDGSKLKTLTGTTHSTKSAERKKSLLDQKRGILDCFQNISISNYYLLFKLYYFYRQM